MNLLLLGTGGMAHTHARAFSDMDGVQVTACADIDLARAQAFADTHAIPEVYGSIEEALGQGGFDAVSNATPDAAHFPTTMLALEAGLHVFCEKPLATNAKDAAAMTKRAEDLGVTTGVNLTYRNVAALQAAREFVNSGRMGKLRHFEAAYLQSWLTQPAWGDWRTDETWLWRLSSHHGSLGALGDIGIHIFDFTTFSACSEIAAIQPMLSVFPKADGDRIGDYHFDANDSMMMTARLECGATGVIHATRFAPGHMNDLSLRLFGTSAGLEVTNSGPLGTLRVCEGSDMETGAWQDIALSPVPTNYERFVDAVRRDGSMDPDFRVALGLQNIIDATLSAARSEVSV